MTEFTQWHRALVFALLGRSEEVGVQTAPDLPELLRWFTPERREQVAAVATARRAAGLAWPVPLPDDLAPPAAQFAAAVLRLRDALGLIGAPATPASDAVRTRPRSAEDERLLREVPPHHGR